MENIMQSGMSRRNFVGAAAAGVAAVAATAANLETTGGAE